MRDQCIAVGDQFVDELELQRLVGPHQLALGQERHRRFEAEQAHHLGDPAPAREQAQAYLGTAQLDFRVGYANAPVRGEADFPAAAQRGAVDRRDHRSSA